MPRASHGEDRFVATRTFTDREEPVRLFEEAVAEAQAPDAYRVLVWYGVGGQGKSALCRELQRRIRKRRKSGKEHIALATLDFDRAEDRSLEQAMLKLRLQLGRDGSFALPTFDLAYARYFALQRPGADIRKAHPELYRTGENELVDDLIDWAEAPAELAMEAAGLVIPGANLLYKYGTRLTGRAREWWDRREVRQRLADLDQLTAPDLLERLPTYLGFDLGSALAKDAAPRVVVMIDTYEALWRETVTASAGDTLRTDDWVRSLVEEAPGVLFAVFGRDRLRWEEVPGDWGPVLDQHLLGGLSDQDADRFLAGVPIAEPEIRARIVEGSRGLPFYLDLAVDQYEDLMDAETPPTAEAFGSTPATVLERFLDHLGERERQDLNLASYPASLSEPLLAELGQGFAGGAATMNWGRLARRSFMEQGADGRLAMHALMREELQDRERRDRPTVFRDIHGALFERFETRAKPADVRSTTDEHERAFLAATEHLGMARPGDVLGYVQANWRAFYDAARWRGLEIVLFRLIGVLADGSAGMAWTLHELASVRQAMGRNADSEGLYLQALEIKKATIGERHPDYAATLHELARVRQAMGRNADAEGLYLQALEILRDTLGERHPSYATTLHALAHVRQAMGRNAEAEGLYLQVREIEKATIGERHPDYAATLHELAHVRQAMGRDAEAEGLYLQALEIKKATIGERHPGYAATLHELARVRQAMGRNADAEGLYLQALEIKKATIGERHPDYATTLHALAHVRQAMGRNADAEPLYKLALEIFRDTLGERHPHTEITAERLKALRQAMEESADD